MKRCIKVLMCGLLLLLGLGLSTACSRKAEPEGPSDPSSRERGTMTTLIEGATGKQALESGRKAQEQIRDISQQKDQQLQEILGEE